jgi:hypothetical protein
MKKSFILGGVVILVLVIAGGFFLTEGESYGDENAYPEVSNVVGCNDSPEERCEKLPEMEKECCLGSLNEAVSNGWNIMGPETCIAENGMTLASEYACDEGFDLVSAQCKGSLLFCVEQ